MADEPSESGARESRRLPFSGSRGIVPALVLLLLAAIIGGVIGGVIVEEPWDSQNGDPAANGAACPAARVASEALPSVVTIRASNGQAGGTGSGVVIRRGGYILTNDHVITVGPDAAALSILRSDGGAGDATIVGRDPLTDLAVIKASAASDLPVIALGRSDSLRVGQPVVALGSPLGLTSTVTTGIVSALDRHVRVPSEVVPTAHLVGAIQTDASINPGNSGGALVDCDARLVGINTAGSTVPNSGAGSIGLNFAIPINLADKLADQLIAQGRVRRPSFGMQLKTIPPEHAQAAGGTAGLFVDAVAAGGPAAAAGLRPGDIITELDGEPAPSVDALIVKSLTLRAGDTVHLTYQRQGASQTTTLTLPAA